MSPGVVEGVARVIVDPATSEPLEPGEILVCAATDPSWVGSLPGRGGPGHRRGRPDEPRRDRGAASSACPCVINTVVGTSSIRTGDTVRIDGGAGTVEIVSEPVA